MHGRRQPPPLARFPPRARRRTRPWRSPAAPPRWRRKEQARRHRRGLHPAPPDPVAGGRPPRGLRSTSRRRRPHRNPIRRARREDPPGLPGGDRRAGQTASPDAPDDVAKRLGNRLVQDVYGPIRPTWTKDSSSRLPSAPAHPCRQLRGSSCRSPEDKYVEPRKTRSAPRIAINVSTTAFVTSFSPSLARAGDGGASWPSQATARRPAPGSLEAPPSPAAAAGLRSGFTRATGSRPSKVAEAAGSDDAGETACCVLLGAESTRWTAGRRSLRAAGDGRSTR